jgi:hypothetical protein
MGSVATVETPAYKPVDEEHTIVLHYMTAPDGGELCGTYEFKCSTTDVRDNLLRLTERTLQEEGRSADVTYTLHLPSGDVQNVPPTRYRVRLFRLTAMKRIEFTVSKVVVIDPIADEKYRRRLTGDHPSPEEDYESYVNAVKKYVEDELHAIH